MQNTLPIANQQFEIDENGILIGRPNRINVKAKAYIGVKYLRDAYAN